MKTAAARHESIAGLRQKLSPLIGTRCHGATRPPLSRQLVRRRRLPRHLPPPAGRFNETGFDSPSGTSKSRVIDFRTDSSRVVTPDDVVAANRTTPSPSAGQATDIAIGIDELRRLTKSCATAGAAHLPPKFDASDEDNGIRAHPLSG